MSLALVNGRRMLVVGIALAALFIANTLPAQAADGQVVGGDNNMAGHVTDNGSTARVTFDSGSILNDCPVGLSSCVLEYKWRSKKDCVLCWWSDDTGWIVLPAGTTSRTHCKADGNFQFEMQVRLRWNAPSTKTVETWGKYESRYDVGASVLVSRLIPSAVFNVTNNAGYKATVKIETNTATSDYSAPYTIATSGATYISTDC